MRSARCLSFMMFFNTFVIVTLICLSVYFHHNFPNPVMPVNPITQNQVDALDLSGDKSPVPQFPGDTTGIILEGNVVDDSEIKIEYDGTFIECLENKSFTGTFRIICLNGKVKIQEIKP